jgi:hypothetical protein
MLDREEAGDLIYWTSQGRDKARLNRSAEERATKEWATTMTVSTNESLHSMLYAGGHATDAKLARLLEFNVAPHPLFTKASQVGRQIHAFLMNNYGTVGQEFVRHLMPLGIDGLKAMLDHAINEFPKKYGVSFSGDERFWEIGVVLADLGNQLAKEYGLIQYDYEDATQWALSELKSMKVSAATNRMDAFDALGEFINEINKNFSPELIATLSGITSALTRPEIQAVLNEASKNPESIAQAVAVAALLIPGLAEAIDPNAFSSNPNGTNQILVALLLLALARANGIDVSSFTGG